MKKKIVVLTGAGMSAESGIATFRDGGGLWEQYPVEQVATPEGFEANPQLVLEFYNKRRAEMLLCQPNEGHKGLVDLEADYDVRIITQNVDNLHERAGSSQVMHLHGELIKVRSSGDETLVYELDASKPYIKMGDVCEKGYQLRPHVVWFGEAVPLISDAAQWCEQADIFVIIGTSMNVYPAAGLLAYVDSQVPVFLIDPQAVNTHRADVTHINQGASEGVATLKRLLSER